MTENSPNILSMIYKNGFKSPFKRQNCQQHKKLYEFPIATVTNCKINNNDDNNNNNK